MRAKLLNVNIVMPMEEKHIPNLLWCNLSISQPACIVCILKTHTNKQQKNPPPPPPTKRREISMDPNTHPN